MFAADDKGSSTDICADDYRGPWAFSEPETQAMRNFINQWPTIKIAVNLHAFGNLFIHPFNFDGVENQMLQD
jgi:hypothetical protein